MESLRKYLGTRLYVVRIKTISLCGVDVCIPDTIIVKPITEIRCSEYTCPVYCLYNIDKTNVQFLGCVNLERCRDENYTLKDVIVSYSTTDDYSSNMRYRTFVTFDDMIDFITKFTYQQLIEVKSQVESVKLLDERKGDV